MFSMKRSNAFRPLIIPKKREEGCTQETLPTEKRYICNRLNENKKEATR